MTYNPVECFTTADLTFRAINSFRGGTIADAKPPMREFNDNESGSNDWGVSADLGHDTFTNMHHLTCDEDGTAELIVAQVWPGAPTVVIESLWTVDLHEVSRDRLAEMICESVLGVRFIPLKSRKEARDTEAQGRKDADFVFRVGLARLLRYNLAGQEWHQLDNSDKALRLAQEGNAHLGHAVGHKTGWVKERVPFFSSNVYQDAYFESMYAHMEALYPSKVS